MGELEMTIIGGLVVAAISGAVGWLFSSLAMRKKIKALPEKWVKRIRELINDAVSAGRDDCIVNAKAIVASRNAMRKSLISLSNSLNSEIDNLAFLLGEKVQLAEKFERGESHEIDKSKVWEQLRVLQKYWEMKQDEIKDGLGKVMVEIGVYDI